MSDFPVKPTLNESIVDTIMSVARARGAELGHGFTIAVVDDTATERAVYRMGSADVLTVGLALGKARLVASNGMPSRVWRKLFEEDRFLALTLPLALDRIVGGAVFFGGGYPIEVDATVVGGIGVSGGAEAEDEAVARAGLAAVEAANQFAEINPAD